MSCTNRTLFFSTCATPQGEMAVLTDEAALYLLEFAREERVKKQLERIKRYTGSQVVEGRTSITDLVEYQLKEYFAGHLCNFSVPLAFAGSPFQEYVWQVLQTIPFGQTVSYKELAQRAGKAKACRAVARANAANALAIIIPCHRVIASDGSLSGYAGGKDRKAWLVQHEKACNKVLNG